MQNEVKQWNVVNGRAVAVNPFNILKDIKTGLVKDFCVNNDWFNSFEKWRNNPTNQTYTTLPDRIYNADEVREVTEIKHTKGWSQLRDDEVDLYANSNATTRRRLALAEPKEGVKVITPEHKSFARIDFKNCGLDYDYTICEWCDLKDQLDVAESAILDAEPFNYAPEIKITPCFMTEYEFDVWFKEYMEDNA